MQPAIIDGHTRRYTAPEGHEDDVAALFVREESVGGIPMLRSAWDAEQREATFLLAGAKMILGVSAPVHPVVNLNVGPLPDAFEPVITARRFNCPQRGPVARVEAMICLPPRHLRIWADEPIVAGFATAFAAALVRIEALALEGGCSL